MTTFDHTRHKLIAVDEEGQHLHVTVADLARETAEATASGVIERVIVEHVETPEQAAFRSEALAMIDALRQRIDELQTALATQPAPAPVPSVTQEDLDRIASFLDARIAAATEAVRIEDRMRREALQAIDDPAPTADKYPVLARSAAGSAKSDFDAVCMRVFRAEYDWAAGTT